jgi:hypothetical protein
MGFPRWLTVLLLSGVLSALAAQADFKVTRISPRVADGELVLSGTLELGLTSKVEEALSKGIPIDVIIDVSLYRKRPLIWDRRMQSWVMRRGISYHALSRQYLVAGHRPDAVESFTSLQAALAAMGTLEELKLPLDELPNGEDTYYVSVRASLDVEALPAPLRPVAYTSLAWHLNSGWTEWYVQH